VVHLTLYHSLTGLARVQQIGTAGTFILRPHLSVSLEASIRECTVNSSLLECHLSGIHSVSEFRRCPQHRLHPCPRLSVAQPVLFRRADRASAGIEVHLTSKSESRVFRAAAEFQKVLDHSGLGGGFVTGALAKLQLARAQVLTHDANSAQKSYEDFLALWKNADPDIPIYRQAKTECAQLRKRLT